MNSGKADWRRLGIGFVPFSPMGEGFLTGTIDETKLSWIERGPLRPMIGSEQWVARHAGLEPAHRASGATAPISHVLSFAPTGSGCHKSDRAGSGSAHVVRGNVATRKRSSGSESSGSASQDLRDQTVRGDPPGPDETDGQFRVVGIGASAGGLDAFTALLSALPDDTGMAFVAVSHLDPAHPSALSEILARSTSMSVIDAVDGQVIAPNTIYVLPPGRDMTIDDSRLLLQPRASGILHRPIDLFFRSLADARRHLAIGVVLSGAATDGTLGVRAIKGAGGITFAQDDTAQQTSMPHSAIADGFVDFVLSPSEIAAELGRIARLPLTLESASAPYDDEDAQVADILQIVRRDVGVDFTNYKAGTLRRRILRRMILKRTDRLQDYAEILRATPGEARALHDDLLIGVTSFFRDHDGFEALTRTAFPRLLAAERDVEPIRIWVLGCFNGRRSVFTRDRADRVCGGGRPFGAASDLRERRQRGRH